jgi:hypothetical protein
MRKLKPKIRVGTFVKVKEKKYRHIVYEGVVTESFSDMIQVYGTGWRESFGHHELNLSEVIVTPIEKEKLRFVFDQAIREIEQQKIKSEMKFKDQENYLEEALTKRAQFFA